MQQRGEPHIIQQRGLGDGGLRSVLAPLVQPPRGHQQRHVREGDGRQDTVHGQRGRGV